MHAGVLGTVQIDVEEIGAGRWVPWTQVEDFRASKVDDRHVVVDRESGTVRCGDGRRGRVWQIGERIRAHSYRSGGGAVGNVAPAAISKAPDNPNVKVRNPFPARGGADAEPLPDAARPDPLGVPQPRTSGDGVGFPRAGRTGRGRPGRGASPLPPADTA